MLGKQYAIRSGTGTGLTGNIAFVGKLFNAHGLPLVNHPTIHKRENVHTPSGKCNSLLAIPLKKHNHHQETLIGLLRVDNKKGEDGQSHPTRAFTIEDEWILSIFAEVVVVCLDSAELVEQLNTEREAKERLFSNLPHGAIAVDLRGNVTAFNEKAEQIFGYCAEEVINRKVSLLYFDPEEPSRVGNLLNQHPDGKHTDYETMLRGKMGQQIPIKLSASWLYDDAGQRIGSVGYFEDLSNLKQYQNRFELLLRASNTVAQAQDLTAGLQRLAELLVTLFPQVFCRILLFDESESYLVAEAAAYIPSLSNISARWTPDIGRQIAVSDYEGLEQLLQAGKPRTLRRSDAQLAANLDKLCVRLGFSQPIQSLLLIPLKLGDRVLGLLNLGEFCDETDSQFTPHNNELASTIAAQTTVMLDRMRMLRLTEQARKQLLAFYQVSSKLTSQQEPSQLLRAIVKETCQAAGASQVHLVLIDEQGNTQNPISVTPSASNINPLFVRRDGISMQVYRSGIARVIPDTSKERDLLNPNFFDSGAAVCLPLSLPHQRSGVMWVHYEYPRRFTDSEITALQLYVNQVAIAYDRAQEIERLARLYKSAGAVSQNIVLGNRRATLQSVVTEVQQTLGCDAVILFECNQHQFVPPTFIGMRYPEKMLTLDSEQDFPLVSNLLEAGQVRIVDNLSASPDFRDKGFVVNEKIESLIAVPLQVREQKVGVLFINYRRPHRVTSDEVSTIQFFANQAAIAVRSAQLNEDRARRLKDLESLVELSHQLLRAETLQEMLESAVQQVVEAIGVEYCNIVLPNQEGELISRSGVGWQGDPSNRLSLKEGAGSQTGYTIMTRQPVIVYDYQTEARFCVPSILFEQEVRSGLSVPMIRDDKVVGALLAQTTTLRHFTEEEANLLSLIANQTAIAIRGAERHEEITRKSAHLRAIHNASKAITASFGHEQEVLDQIVRQAAESVTSVGPPKNVIATIQLYDGELNELVFKSVYPVSPILEHVGSRLSLNETKTLDGRIGVPGRTVLTGQSQLVSDVTKDADYLRFNESTLSELSVPLLSEGKIIGALNVESDQRNGFNSEDLFVLEALAEHAVIAIQNARQYQELKETKGLVGSRTALAWMGMTSSVWGHAVVSQTLVIKELGQLLKQDLEQEWSPAMIARAKERIGMIERIADQVMAKPITPVLSSGEGASLVPVNQLVLNRVSNLRQREPYKSAGLKFTLNSSDSDSVRVSAEWLRRVLDILIDNAVEAVKNSKDASCSVEVTTRTVANKVEIIVADNGRGIPVELIPRLFKRKIEKPIDANGLGMGLLMAQTIVETYGGSIYLSKTDSLGTKMAISFPLAVS